MSGTNHLKNKELSLKYQVLSYLIGILVSYLIVSMLLSFILQYIESPKPLSVKLLTLGCTIAFIGLGFIKIPERDYGLITILGRRWDGFFLSEGSWWLPPIPTVFGHVVVNGKLQKTDLEIDKIYSGGNYQNISVKVFVTWKIVDPIPFQNSIDSIGRDGLDKQFQESIRKFVGKVGTTERTLINIQDELKIELIDSAENSIFTEWGVMVTNINITHISGDSKIMEQYEELYKQINQSIAMVQIETMNVDLMVYKFNQIVKQAGLTPEQAAKFFLTMEGKIQRKDYSYDIKLSDMLLAAVKKLLPSKI